VTDVTRTWDEYRLEIKRKGSRVWEYPGGAGTLSGDRAVVDQAARRSAVVNPGWKHRVVVRHVTRTHTPWAPS
jgi:hypothetical protein